MWLWALQDAAGSNLSVLSGARERKLSYRRSSTPEATLKLDLEHDDAYVLQEALAIGGGGLPRLRCFRVEEQADGTDLAVCRFAGTNPVLDEGTDDGTVGVTFRGAFEVLEGRFVGELFTWARDITPAADIAVDLITEADDVFPTGIVIGNVEVTEPRDATYDLKRVADAVAELSDAFDFELVPLADATGQGFDLARFDAWIRQGTDRPEAVFGYGEGTVGNCHGAGRKTTAPRNRVFVTGDEGIVGFAEDTDSQDRYGVWTHTESMSDVLDLSVLTARAQALLQPAPQRVVTFSPNPAKVDDDGELITPQPWRDYWLGDTVRLTIREGSFVYDGAPRVDGVDIDIDDEGFESGHDLTIAADDLAAA